MAWHSCMRGAKKKITLGRRQKVWMHTCSLIRGADLVPRKVFFLEQYSPDKGLSFVIFVSHAALIISRVTIVFLLALTKKGERILT